LVDIIEECLGAAAMMFVWRGKGDVWPGLIEEGQVESRGSEKGVIDFRRSWSGSWRTIQAVMVMGESEMVRIELWMRSTVEHITRGCSLRDLKCKFLLDVFTDEDI
jgi:hypothetical protein